MVFFTKKNCRKINVVIIAGQYGIMIKIAGNVEIF